MKQFAKRRINGSLTKRVEQLHNSGYIYDFAIDAESRVFCMQSNSKVEACELTIKLIDQTYDQLFGNFKYVYAIETTSGEKGILLLPEIYLGNTKEVRE